MNSLIKSRLIRNISRYKLDSRIGRLLLSMKGTGIRLGERISNLPGYCPEIMDYRFYRPGDPIKDIDWKISARLEKLLFKIREGYRQSNFVIVIDTSESMKSKYSPAQIQDARDGSHTSKFITALSTAYIAGRLALKSRDKIFIFWAGELNSIDSESRLLNTLVEIEYDKTNYNLWQGDFSKKANYFIFSDFFLEIEELSAYLKNLLHVSKNLFVFPILDTVEEEFSFNSRSLFIDPEDTSRDNSMLAQIKEIKNQYLHIYKDHFKQISKFCKAYGIRYGKIKTLEDPLNAFVKAVS